MKEEENYIYQITVRNHPDNKTEVSKCLDPLFDAKLLLEGVGVLIPHISEWTKTHPRELKEDVFDMEIEQVIKKLQEYLEITGRSYLNK